MMNRKHLLIAAAFTVLAASSNGGVAKAAFPWFKRAGLASTELPTAYGPQTQHYVVVSPTPPAAGGAHAPAGAAGAWDERQLVAPAYPWGWFGSRGSPQAWTHERYYNHLRDHAIIRAP